MNTYCPDQPRPDPRRRPVFSGPVVNAIRVLILAFSWIDFAAAADLQRVDLFTSGSGGYGVYRIPGILMTSRGTGLAWCEARRRPGTDWSATDILARRSEDGGNTWSPPYPIARIASPIDRNPVALSAGGGRPEERTLHNGVMIPSPDGILHFVFCAEYMRAFHCISTDDGRSFSEPSEITATFDAFRPEYPWKVLATGPGHGIRLRSGRLILPVWLSTGTGGHGHRPSCVSTIFSDDQGKSWRRGDIVASHSDSLVNPSESVLAELADGRVMMNIRSESAAHRRAVAISANGSTGWTRPVFDDALFEPVCHAGMIRWPGNPQESRATLLFSNPDSSQPASDGSKIPRRNLTLRLSADDGKTWPVQKSIDSGRAGYSDLAVTPDQSFWCFYEAGSTVAGVAPASLSLVRGNLDWLMIPPSLETEGSFSPLFNGRNLDGWTNVNCGPGTWVATNGLIFCTGAPIGELRTTRMYQNFVLELEWRHLRPKGNAGVFVWSDALPARGQPFIRGVEVQVLDGLEGPGHTSDGDVFPIHGSVMQPLNGRGGDRAFPVTRRMHPSPEWNHYRILCVDGMILHAVNGRIVTRGVGSNPRKGYICLESEGSPVEFRNILIRELGGPELSGPQIATAFAGHLSHYNGVDLSGWKSSADGPGAWMARDWNLVHNGSSKGERLTHQSAVFEGDGFLDFRWADSKRPGDWRQLLDGWVDGEGGVQSERPTGEWNRLEWNCQGVEVSLRLNGQPVSNVKLREASARQPLRIGSVGVPVEIANIFSREP